MLALIDADIISHRIGFTTEQEEKAIARWRCDDLIERILVDTKANKYRLYLSDSKENNFRYKIDPSYKANRTAPKPKHYDFLKEHMIVEWGAMISHDMEADDALGIDQDKSGKSSVICSIDKDLLQIPGLHYNFVKGTWTTVDVQEGLLSFYRSILVGDVSDNIKGIFGIGPVKAKKILPKWIDERTALLAIWEAYFEWRSRDKLDFDITETIRKNGRLLKIKQTEGEGLWDSEHLKQTETSRQLSTPTMEEALSQSTEPTTQAQITSDGSPVVGLKKDDISPMETRAI